VQAFNGDFMFKNDEIKEVIVKLVLPLVGVLSAAVITLFVIVLNKLA
jgi:hypothetical protein